MVTLQSDFLTVKIHEKGAELKSIVCDGKEYIWQGDEKFWAGSAPVLFPICGGLTDDRYTLDGREYTLLKHGFAKNMVFQVEKSRDESAVFLLTSTADTYAQFPFAFEFRILYSLSGRKLSVTYDVKNLSETEMYFSVGAHEGYACPEGIEAYEVVFPQKETLDSTVLDGNLLSDEKQRIIENSDTLALKYDYFAVDALVFQELRSRSVVLKNQKEDRKIAVSFDGFDHLLLWTKPQAGYICIEPWCGIPDTVHADGNFKNKEGIQKLSPGGRFERTHTIEIL